MRKAIVSAIVIAVFFAAGCVAAGCARSTCKKICDCIAIGDEDHCVDECIDDYKEGSAKCRKAMRGHGRCAKDADEDCEAKCRDEYEEVTKECYD